jgi:hypothetical protein
VGFRFFFVGDPALVSVVGVEGANFNNPGDAKLDTLLEFEVLSGDLLPVLFFFFLLELHAGGFWSKRDGGIGGGGGGGRGVYE